MNTDADARYFIDRLDTRCFIDRLKYTHWTCVLNVDAGTDADTRHFIDRID